MTLRANARLAGLKLLLYFVTGIGSAVLSSQTSAGDGTAARLASIAQHATLVRVSALQLLLEFLCELVLAVTFYAGPAALCFSVGNLIFASLFLRARSIPVRLAWLGVVASILGLVELSLEMLGFLHGPGTYVPWIPMALFLALWLLIKSVAVRSAPAPYPTPSGSLAE